MKKTTPMRAGGRVPVAPGPRPPVAPMRAGGRVPVAPGPRPPVAPMRAGGRVPVAPGPRPPVAPMRAGGLAAGHKAADGIAQHGKTKARQVRMNAGKR